MKTTHRSFMPLIGMLFLFAVTWFSDRYKQLDLPEWLQFTRTIYGSLAMQLIYSTAVIALVYLARRQVEMMDAATPRQKAMVRWAFRITVGTIILGLAFDITSFFARLHANG